MTTHDIRLIAMDMDGTLLNPKQVISPDNAEALRMASQAGIKLAICSGRAASDIAMFALENGLDDCALLGTNGTYCWLSPNREVVSNHVFSQQALDAMIRILNDEKILTAYFAQNKVLVLNDPTNVSATWWTSHRTGPYALKVLYGMEAVPEVSIGGVNKLVATTEEPERLARARKQLEKVEGLEITSSWINNLEIMPAGCNKGTAVSELAAQLGLKREHVMTFGDYDNDLPMIEWAGMGVAMGNACEKVKSVAKFVTRTNAEDGVGWAIRKIALGLEEA